MYHTIMQCIPAKRLVCTEKQTIWKITQKLFVLAEGVRREGLLWLDTIAETENDVFLRSCLRYISDADPTPMEFQEYCSIWMLTANVTDTRVLEMAVISDGLKQILLQKTPCIILRHLGAWLGEDYADKI